MAGLAAVQVHSIKVLGAVFALASVWLSSTSHAEIPPARFVNELPECRSALFEDLMAIDHVNGDMQALIDNRDLMATCTLAPEVDHDTPLGRRVRVMDGTVNFESAHVHPLDVTPNSGALLAVNTAGHRLEVFSVNQLGISQRLSVPVGLDPVSVRVRSDSEAWVVNQLSDSISIVDLESGDVLRTLTTGNEPADVVFSPATGRAFVSLADANQIEVYSLANLDQPPSRIVLGFEEPRALAVSADGSTVYAASFLSGSGTTVVSGRPGPVTSGAVGGSEDIVGKTDSASGGVNPVPNREGQFVPPLSAGNPGFSSLIVQQDASGAWRDDSGNDWQAHLSGADASASGREVGWRLSDRDVAVIDAATLAVQRYQTGVMTMLMGMDVNPITGEVIVVGIDSDNHRRFESVLQGVFARVEFSRFTPGESSQSFDLNPHIDYSESSSDAALRMRSIGDPRAIKWHPDGDRFFVAGMGSNNVIVLDINGQRIGRIEVGEGPTGIALIPSLGRGYALNKFDGTLSEFDLDSYSVGAQTAFFDPTHESVQLGRPHLYNTHRGSGHGHLACASCHVDGRTDRLAWDLGQPDGQNTVLHHAMKSAMRTQPLLDVIRHPNMHWRGDRSELREFLQTFSDLQAATPINGLEISEFENFLGSIHLPPSPWRNEDNSLPSSVLLPENPVAATGNAVLGRQKLNACIGCHSNNFSRSDVSNAIFAQNVVPPDFAQFYKRLGFSASNGEVSTSGFGFFHDGADPLMAAVPDADILAALLAFDGPNNGLSATQLRLDSHAALGRQHTVRGLASPGDLARVAELVGYAEHSHLSLVAKHHNGARWTGYRREVDGSFRADRVGEPALSLAELIGLSEAGSLTVTVVLEGTQDRIGIDRDFDSVLDGDDNTPPSLADPGSIAIALDTEVELDLNGQDLDGDNLTFLASGLPAGLALDAASGLISGQATEVGTSPVFASASDGRDVRSVHFEIQVEDSGGGDANTGDRVGGVSVTTGGLAAWLFLPMLLCRRRTRASAECAQTAALCSDGAQ